MSKPPFIFATGIENSYPTIRLSDGRVKRVDEMEKCCHYHHWREDFELVREIGATHLRYGPPYYRTHLGPGRYDWSFADETLKTLHDSGIVVIADLCHFGVPDWIGSLQNPEFPTLFAEYAQAFAVRYPWIRFFTPINEIFILATFSGLNGWWNDCGTSDRTFVTIMMNVCKANVLAMRAILSVNANPVFIQSESSEYFHADEPSCEQQANFYNQRRFLSLDLTYGNAVDVPIYEYLLDNGVSREAYHWFQAHHVRARCVMGNDYYITNEHLVRANNEVVPSDEIFGYYVITHQYYSRFRLPVMYTETNLKDAEKAPHWLRKEWANTHRLKQDGVPIIGFTWYSLTDQVDWDTALREDAGRVNPCGLYDLKRKIRPVGTAYKRMIQLWKDIIPRNGYGLHPDY